MKNRLHSHVFWGGYSPFSALTGCVLIILATSRLAFALVCAGCLLWTYILTGTICFFTQKFMPVRGRSLVIAFLSAFICSLYLLLAGLINPLAIMGCWFFLILIPPCLADSMLLFHLQNEDPIEALSRTALEAVNLGVILILISLIREPLGFGSLSFPGGRGGFVEIFSSTSKGFFSIEIISITAGGLLLFGFITALFRFLNKTGEL